MANLINLRLESHTLGYLLVTSVVIFDHRVFFCMIKDYDSGVCWQAWLQFHCWNEIAQEQFLSVYDLKNMANIIIAWKLLTTNLLAHAIYVKASTLEWDKYGLPLERWIDFWRKEKCENVAVKIRQAQGRGRGPMLKTNFCLVLVYKTIFSVA